MPAAWSSQPGAGQRIRGRPAASASRLGSASEATTTALPRSLAVEMDPDRRRSATVSSSPRSQSKLASSATTLLPDSASVSSNPANSSRREAMSSPSSSAWTSQTSVLPSVAGA